MVENSCEACPIGQFYNSIFCEDCSINCASCSGSATTCTSCSSPNPVLNNGICEECPDGQYASDLDTCEYCNRNCLTCIADSTICSSCEYGYYLDDDFTCKYCDRSCSVCDGSSIFDCLSCFDGYYLTESNTCESCSSNCLTCSNNPIMCTSCNDGYRLTSSNTCVVDPNQISAFIQPTTSTRWSINQYGCIKWKNDETVLQFGDTANLMVEYGANLARSRIIANTIDLTIGQFQWRISNIYPGIVRLKMEFRTGETLYSPRFKIFPYSNIYNNLC